MHFPFLLVLDAAFNLWDLLHFMVDMISLHDGYYEGRNVNISALSFEDRYFISNLLVHCLDRRVKESFQQTEYEN